MFVFCSCCVLSSSLCSLVSVSLCSCSVGLAVLLLSTVSSGVVSLFTTTRSWVSEGSGADVGVVLAGSARSYCCSAGCSSSFVMGITVSMCCCGDVMMRVNGSSMVGVVVGKMDPGSHSNVSPYGVFAISLCCCMASWSTRCITSGVMGSGV